MNQSILIYRDENDFHALSAITRAPVRSSHSAAELIQFALDETAHGEVFLESGEYPLDRPIRLDSHRRLNGRGRGTRLRPNGNGIRADQAEGSTVSNLSLLAEDGSTGNGIVFDGCGDCRVQEIFVAGFSDFGIVLQNHCFLCEVRGCQLADNRQSGLLLKNLLKGRVGDYIQNHVSHTTVYGGGEGIRCDEATVVNLTGCSIFQSGGHAFHLISSNSVLISGCRTFQITGSAVVAEKSHELNVSSGIFCWHTEDGIRLKACRWGVLSANEVIDTGSFNPGTPDQSTRFEELPPIPGKIGIRLEDIRGFTVSANTVFNWPQGCRMSHGITEDSASRKNIVQGNNINYFSKAAVRCEGAESLVTGNLDQGPDPHYSVADFPLIQSFEAHRIQEFIDRQRA
ncbi:MAG: right-handed parallel beta-helix repeat-containing protein [Verrucomicrobia bacterium]|nr:right-handed parallel beta-helix repeat-containing protein [Verrucomicrobiota bacterium]MCH8511180.1 right-handed parallel beta-helix repeat-containing protein [Kiritimatiellia bacterium]